MLSNPFAITVILPLLLWACTPGQSYKLEDSPTQGRKKIDQSCQKRGPHWVLRDSVCRPKSFLDYCKTSAQLSKPAQITVQVVLNELGTETCEDAAEELESMKQLDLSDFKLTDIRPLGRLPRLGILRLENNQLSNIDVLKSYTSLRVLRLDQNQVKSVDAIAQLKSLVVLRLDHNRIDNIAPLSGLVNLAQVNLNHNRIKKIGPLAQLGQLRKIGLDHNQISDLGPLRNLKNLQFLTIRENPISALEFKKTAQNCPFGLDVPRALGEFCHEDEAKANAKPATES